MLGWGNRDEVPCSHRDLRKPSRICEESEKDWLRHATENAQTNPNPERPGNEISSHARNEPNWLGAGCMSPRHPMSPRAWPGVQSSPGHRYAEIYPTNPVFCSPPFMVGVFRPHGATGRHQSTRHQLHRFSLMISGVTPLRPGS